MVTYPFNFNQTKTLKEAVYVLREQLKKEEPKHYKWNVEYYENITDMIEQIWDVQYREKYGLKKEQEN